jgi:hypothetical protein
MDSLNDNVLVVCVLGLAGSDGDYFNLFRS